MNSLVGLYAIADSEWNPCPTLACLVRQFLEGGSRLVQLRMKSSRVALARRCLSGGRRASRVEIYKTAQEIMSLKQRFDFTFIINDHADIAAEIGADGVHVGETDEPIEAIRKKFGPEFIIGYSSHSIEEAMRANDRGADYLAFGAIFPTRTKGPGHPVQGTELLNKLVRLVNVPVVAIGGIRRDNVAKVIMTGVSAVAMITALSEAKDVVAETKWFVEQVHPGTQGPRRSGAR